LHPFSPSRSHGTAWPPLALAPSSSICGLLLHSPSPNAGDPAVHDLLASFHRPLPFSAHEHESAPRRHVLPSARLPGGTFSVMPTPSSCSAGSSSSSSYASSYICSGFSDVKIYLAATAATNFLVCFFSTVRSSLATRTSARRPHDHRCHLLHHHGELCRPGWRSTVVSWSASVMLRHNTRPSTPTPPGAKHARTRDRRIQENQSAQ
jgi:hypothetical protein